ncbi:symmetrical bis(5'-nucleosyl)-tetraphosphatase, partial [Acinetobacter baumannii]
DWLNWLRQQRLAVHAHGWLMVHAGVLPQWDVAQTVALAGEVEAMLRSPELGEFLTQMYGNAPERWDDSLSGVARWRCVVNSLTRLRFCSV